LNPIPMNPSVTLKSPTSFVGAVRLALPAEISAIMVESHGAKAVQAASAKQSRLTFDKLTTGQGRPWSPRGRLREGRRQGERRRQ